MLSTTILGASALSLVSLLAAPAAAQDVLLDVKGPPGGANASAGIAVGDWDGDGVGDLAIGAAVDNTAAPLAGVVRIHSGLDGSVLTSLYGKNAGDYFGLALARTPDLDGDGIDDLAVTAPFTDFGVADSGSVYLYAGRTGKPLRHIDAATTKSYFGYRLGVLGDVDGD